MLILHKQEAGNIGIPADRQNLNEFLARGGGLVVIHAGTVSRDPDWFKGIVGGSWRNGTTKWLEGPMQLYFTDRDSPITKDVSNWAMDDEIYYDMDILPESRILAAAYTPKPLGRNPAAPETGRGAHRWRQARERLRRAAADVDLRAHGGWRPDAVSRLRFDPCTSTRISTDRTTARFSSAGSPGPAKRANADELLTKKELGDNLRYVEGGPTAPAKAAEKIEIHPEFDLTLVAAPRLALLWQIYSRRCISPTCLLQYGHR